MLPGLAHVKWFSEGDEASTIANLSSTEWLIVAVSIILGIVLMWLVSRLMRPIDEKLDNRFKSLREWVPTIVRYSTAGLIIFNYWHGYLYAPNIEYNDGTLFLLVNAVLILVALMMIFGILTRLGGALLLASFAIGVFVAQDPLQLLDHLEYVGLGLFLMLSVPGKLSVQTKLSDPLDSLSSRSRLASPLLKTFAGISLVILAFSEKLMNMTLSNDFLLEHDWNFLSSFGLSDRNFIIAVAVIEVLIGLTLVLNLAPRLGTLSLLFAMITTAALLGVEEVFGHMFAVAVVAVVWVGPNNNLIKIKKQSS